MSGPNPRAIEALADLLHEDPEVLFITGAGLSADSGLPTYRGIGGLYGDRDVDEGVSIEEALSGSMFRRNPGLTWKYVHQIEGACRGASPNRGHRVMAALEQRLTRCWTLTQNVDGLHRAAGATNVIEIHGDVHDLLCTRCSWTEWVTDYSDVGPLPLCPDCDSVVRPKVVLFGEMLPDDAVEALHRELGRGFGMVFSVGTSALFPYIAGPVFQAAAMGVPTVEINPGRSEISDVVRWRFECGAAVAFGALADAMGIP